MKGDTVTRKVTVTNPQGFHMRPAQDFVLIAGPYNGTVTVTRSGKPPANGKSILSLLSLAAEQDHALEIEVCGSNPETLVAQLLAVFDKTYDEG